jgi:hypothetical protein
MTELTKLPVVIVGTLAAVAFGLVPAVAAGGGSGLAISPAIIEHAATPGPVGGLMISNTTGEALRITVSARPWLEAPSGAVIPDQRRTLDGVSLSATSFTLASGGSQAVALSLGRVPASGSIYGSVDVLGVPVGRPAAPDGVVVDYRLIATLRLDPARPVYAASGAVLVAGDHRSGDLALAVRNTGNTVTAIGGSARITGPSGSSRASIPAIRLVPGLTVDVPLLKLRGSLPAGAYSLAYKLTAHGKVVAAASRPFKLR